MSSHGNRKKQQKRRRERLKHRPDFQEKPFELVDGNFTHYPAAFCNHHGAWLTEGLMQTHRCEKRHCKRLQKGVLCGNE